MQLLSDRRRSALLSSLGLGAVFVFHLLCFHEGRDLWHFPQPVPLLCLGSLLGIILGGVLLPLRFAWPRVYRCSLACTIICGTLCWLWALEANVPTLALFAQIGVTLPLPFFFQQAFASQRLFGLRLSLALAGAYLLWLLPTIIADLVCLRFFQLLLLVAGIVALVCSALLPALEQEIDDVNDNQLLEPKLARETFFYLLACMFVFFVLSSVWEWIFYRMHADDFPIPREVFLYYWLILPLLGLWLDRANISLKLIIACYAIIVLAPLLSAAFEGQIIFWSIYVLAMTARSLALLYFLLVFARFSTGSGRSLRFSGLVVAMPWFCFLAAFFLGRQFSHFYVGILPFLMICMVFSFSFSFLASRVQYALTLSGAITLPKTDSAGGDNDEQSREKGDKQEKEQNFKQHMRAQEYAEFARTYGISQREQEVLTYILDGKDTSAIARSLFISENTVKTHVRQLLRKTGCHTRIALTSLFFHEISEERGTNDEQEKIS